MAAETNVLSIPVRMDTAAFREFSAFDVLTRQKRWRRPLLFAVLMVAFAIVCFTQVGQREGAALLGTVLTVVGVGLPIVYFATFFQSVSKQAKQLKLETPHIVRESIIAKSRVGQSEHNARGSHQRRIIMIQDSSLKNISPNISPNP